MFLPQRHVAVVKQRPELWIHYRSEATSFVDIMQNDRSSLQWRYVSTIAPAFGLFAQPFVQINSAETSKLRITELWGDSLVIGFS